MCHNIAKFHPKDSLLVTRACPQSFVQDSAYGHHYITGFENFKYLGSPTDMITVNISCVWIPKESEMFTR